MSVCTEARICQWCILILKGRRRSSAQNCMKEAKQIEFFLLIRIASDVFSAMLLVLRAMQTVTLTQRSCCSSAMLLRDCYDCDD